MKHRLVFGFTLAFFISGAADAGTVQEPSNWITLTAGSAFTVKAPLGTTPKNYQGIDSYVGGFTNPRFELMFDYGWYSNDLSGFRDDARYTMEATKIDGRDAVIVTGPGENSWGCNDYLSAVYLVVSRSRWSGRTTRFEMSGCTKNQENLPILHMIFHSLHFLEN